MTRRLFCRFGLWEGLQAQAPVGEGLAVIFKDAVVYLGQVKGDVGQIYLADDVLEFVYVHPRVLHTAQGDVKAEVRLDDTAFSLEMLPDVLDQRQEILWGVGGGEVDDLAVGTRGKGVEQVEGDGGRHGIVQQTVEPRHHVHAVGGKVQESHRDVVIAALPAYVDAAQQVAQLPEPVVVKGDGYFYFEISFHRFPVFNTPTACCLEMTLSCAVLFNQITQFFNVITKILIKMPVTPRRTDNRANNTSYTCYNAKPEHLGI